MLPRLAVFFIVCSAAHASLTVTTPEIRGIPVVRTVETAGFALTVTNTGESRESGSFHATLTPPSGQPVVEVGRTIALAPGETLRVPVALTGAELGVWTITHTFNADAVKPEDKPAAGSRRFAVMDPTGPNETCPAFRFGIVAHIENERDKSVRAREIAAAALTGVKIIRTNPDWWTLQPKPDKWRWEIMDELVAGFAADGMAPQVMFAFTVPWAADPSIKWDNARHGFNVVRSAPNSDAWRNYVATMVRRYKGRVPLWEPWNEPDLGFWLGTTEEYIEMARITIEEVRRNDPDAKVMTGGFATLTAHPGRKLNPDMQERVMRELGPRFDYHAVHEHGPFPDFVHIVDGALATLRAGLSGPVPPLFFNETALTALGSPDAEQIQAEALVKKTTFARSRGAAGYLWYDLRNDGVDAGNPEHHYGLVTHDFQPKPVYTAFNTYARLVVPRPFLRQLDSGKGRWLFLHGAAPAEAAPGSLLLVYWNDDPAAQNEQLLLHLPGARRVSQIDLNGNVAAHEITDGNVTISLAARPCYLLVEGASDIEIKGRLVGPVRPYFGGPGDAVEVSCEFINPFDRPLRVNVKWASPLAMQVVSPAAPAVELPPLGKGRSSLTVRLPEGASYRFGQNARLLLDYAYAGTPLAGRLQIPVQYGTIRVPSREASPVRAPDVVLDRSEQLHSFIEADPNLLAHRWSGPDDLSARLWFGADESSLVLRIEVADNRHQQAQTDPVAIWREDSVQVVIEVPGRAGFWEFGLAENEAEPVSNIWVRPHDAGPGAGPVGLKVERQGVAGEGRVYTARLPRALLGLTDEVLRTGFRFNVAVNDHDGVVRAHALQLVPGIVDQKSTESIPYVIFK